MNYIALIKTQLTVFGFIALAILITLIDATYPGTFFIILGVCFTIAAFVLISVNLQRDFLDGEIE